MKTCLECGVSPGDPYLEYTPALIGFCDEDRGVDWFCAICLVRSSASPKGFDYNWLYSLIQNEVRLISAKDAAADNAEFSYTPA